MDFRVRSNHFVLQTADRRVIVSQGISIREGDDWERSDSQEIGQAVRMESMDGLDRRGVVDVLSTAVRVVTHASPRQNVLVPSTAVSPSKPRFPPVLPTDGVPTEPLNPLPVTPPYLPHLRLIVMEW